MSSSPAPHREQHTEVSRSIDVSVNWNDFDVDSTVTATLPAGYVVESHSFSEFGKGGDAQYGIYSVGTDNVMAWYRVKAMKNTKDHQRSWLNVTLHVRGVSRS